MGTPQIHLATRSEVETLLDVSKQTFESTFIGTFQRPYTTEDLSKYYSTSYSNATYLGWIEDKHHAIFLLKIQSKICGYAVVGPCTLPHAEVTMHCGELKRFYILKADQGKGHGRILLNHALGWLDKNFSAQWIGVWSNNTRAQRIYQKRGFVKVGEYDYPVGGTIDREFILRKLHV